jgi:hypothetical protein
VSPAPSVHASPVPSARGSPAPSRSPSIGAEREALELLAALDPLPTARRAAEAGHGMRIGGVAAPTQPKGGRFGGGGAAVGAESGPRGPLEGGSVGGRATKLVTKLIVDRIHTLAPDSAEREDLLSVARPSLTHPHPLTLLAGDSLSEVVCDACGRILFDGPRRCAACRLCSFFLCEPCSSLAASAGLSYLIDPKT